MLDFTESCYQFFASDIYIYICLLYNFIENSWRGFNVKLVPLKHFDENVLDFAKLIIFKYII